MLGGGRREQGSGGGLGRNVLGRGERGNDGGKGCVVGGMGRGCVEW